MHKYVVLDRHANFAKFREKYGSLSGRFVYARRLLLKRKQGSAAEFEIVAKRTKIDWTC